MSFFETTLCSITKIYSHPPLKNDTECSQVSAENSVFQKLGIHTKGQLTSE